MIPIEFSRGGSSNVYDNECLLAQVAGSIFCVRNRIAIAGVRHLWSGLCNFITVCLKSHKGVLLPGLGTFCVGQALEDRFATYKRYRPVFSLQEGRFGGVSQERSKYRLLNRSGVTQLNYQLIVQGGTVHRAIAQRIVAELLQHIAAAIVAGSGLRVAFPGVGQLVRNRAGRIEFQFDAVLVEALELGLGPGTPCWSMGYDVPVAMSRPVSVSGIGSRAGGASSPVVPCQPSHAAVLAAVPLQSHLHSPRSAAPQQQAAAVPLPQLVQQAMQCLRELLLLCQQADRAVVGAVPRGQLEAWLQSHCRPLLSAVDAATMLDLLLQHTFGTSGRFVQYGSLVADLQELVMSAAPLAHPAQAPSCPEEAEALAAAAYANAAAPVAPLPLSRPETAPVPAAQQPRRPPPLAWVQQQQQLQEEEQLLPAAQQQLLDQQQLQPLLSPVMHQAPPKQQPAAFARRPVVPAAPQPSLRSRPSSAMVSESGGIMPLNHYLQNMISPRSRSEYDAFNRFHFSRQQQAGRDPRAVTPKVGEEPLNRSEVAALRAELASPRASAEVALRVQSPQVTRPSNKVDHVADILQLDGLSTPPQDPLLPAMPDRDRGGAGHGWRGSLGRLGGSYGYGGSRDHIYEHGVL